MRIEFDPVKDAANRAKHGVSLALAGELDWDAALVWVDDRFDYAELRMIALAPTTGVLYSWPSWIVARSEGSSACVEPTAVRSSTMSKAPKRPAVAMPTVAEDRVITSAAKSDPDALPLTPRQLKAMVPLQTLRGRPKSDNPKQLVSVRYSQEVLAYFKSTGEGWQSRMDRVLRDYVSRQVRRAQR
jgi:uncharacterized protein (DUF4415 family)